MQKVHFLITSLPPELFAIFCAFLPPSDLITLSQVCRKFRGYLCEPNSFSTQQIWKESRLRFMPKGCRPPPPERMNEKNYVELLMRERGCQICKRVKKSKIYWEFDVRCCDKCFLKNTVTIHKLVDAQYPQEFLDILPHNSNFNCTRRYWKKHVDFEFFQYFYGLPGKYWLNDKKRMSNSIMKYAKQRKLKEKDPPRPYARYRRSINICFMEDVRNNIKNIPQLIQFHIQRIENRSYQPDHINLLRLLMVVQNYEQIIEQIESIELIISMIDLFFEISPSNSVEKKKNNIKVKKVKKNKNKRECYSKHNEFQMKRKNTKNKFAHKYG